MIDWTLVIPAAVAIPSIASLYIVKLVIRHREQSLAKSMEHTHVWSYWDEAPVIQRVVNNDKPGDAAEDIRERYSRTCGTCGEKEYKVYSRQKEKWL